MAERGGHAPHHAKCATISLAKNPGSLVRFTFHRCPRQERKRGSATSNRGAVAACRWSGNCTCTIRVLSSVPLLLGYVGVEMRCSRSDSHRH